MVELKHAATYLLRKSVTFEAAHFLPYVDQGHPCGRVHGHSYTITAEISGPLDETKGWVRDFAELAGPLRGIAAALDHCLLNDVPGLENPTSEALCDWIWEALAGGPERGRPCPDLDSVTVSETATSSCTIRRSV